MRQKWLSVEVQVSSSTKKHRTPGRYTCRRTAHSTHVVIHRSHTGQQQVRLVFPGALLNNENVECPRIHLNPALNPNKWFDWLPLHFGFLSIFILYTVDPCSLPCLSPLAFLVLFYEKCWNSLKPNLNSSHHPVTVEINAPVSHVASTLSRPSLIQSNQPNYSILWNIRNWLSWLLFSQ